MPVSVSVGRAVNLDKINYLNSFVKLSEPRRTGWWVTHSPLATAMTLSAGRDSLCKEFLLVRCPFGFTKPSSPTLPPPSWGKSLNTWIKKKKLNDYNRSLIFEILVVRRLSVSTCLHFSSTLLLWPDSCTRWHLDGFGTRPVGSNSEALWILAAAVSSTCSAVFAPW